jgi:single-strand DNA-binding protein
MLQKITLIGHLGDSPNMRFTPQGKAVTNFSVAVNGYNDNTAWFRITTWEEKAEHCKEYLTKGSKVYIEGRLDFDPKTGGPETYVSKKDGQTHASFNVTAFQVLFLSSKGEKQEIPEKAGKVPWKS